MNEFERCIDELCSKGRKSNDDLTSKEKRRIFATFLISGHDRRAVADAIYESFTFAFLAPMLGDAILDSSLDCTIKFMSALCITTHSDLINIFNEALQEANEAKNLNKNKVLK